MEYNTIYPLTTKRRDQNQFLRDIGNTIPAYPISPSTPLPPLPPMVPPHQKPTQVSTGMGFLIVFIILIVLLIFIFGAFNRDIDRTFDNGFTLFSIHQ